MKQYQKIDDWFHTDLGQSVLKAEKNEIAKIIGSYFGYHLAQLGFIASLDWVEASPIQHKFWCSPWWRENHLGSGVKADLCALPFTPKSLDLLLIPHVLEFEDMPYAIIEQACNVLIPEGYLIILGFNPYSIWGVNRWLQNKNTQPWQARFHSLGTIRKWLSQNNCIIDHYHTFCFQLPFQESGIRQRLKIVESIGQTCWPTNGGVYCIIARKQVVTATPIQIPWRIKLFGYSKKRVTEPTTREPF